MKVLTILLMVLATATSHAGQEYLIKLKDQNAIQLFSNQFQIQNLKFNNWVMVELTEAQLEEARQSPNVLYVEKNMRLGIDTTVKVHDPVLRQYVIEQADLRGFAFAENEKDNPDFPGVPAASAGSDPLFDKQWGMRDIGVEEAWRLAGTKGSPEIVVAVLDTGVDYTHEDLLPNMWRNPGESGVDANGNDMASNGIDDDNNGYVDDLMGWDFAKDDNKPYDLSKKGFSLLFGGNPGHGTHCAGNVAARGDNGKGIAGVAPNVKIMAMRFLSEEGSGSTAGAIGAIRYAIDNGARVLSNSWGSVGDGGDVDGSRALQEAIQYAQDNDVIFIAAAGNGKQGVGYDNDSDSEPAYPASYPQDVIVSVAALDEQDALGSFSNWGAQTVDLGAPGVKVFSTVPDNDYQDTVLNIPGLITATWDGTSMATPHVSGAAALYLSAHPEATYSEVKEALLQSATPINALNGKAVTGGKLDVKAMMEL